MDLSITGKEKDDVAEISKAHWKHPLPNTMKMNVDASFSETDHTAATRAGVRGHDGPLVRAQALWVENVPNALTNEALAVRDGVRLACDMRLQNVIIGTDVKGVADLWKKRDEGRSEIAYILMDIEGMSEGFHSFFLDHVGREANQLAHLCDGRASHTRRR